MMFSNTTSFAKDDLLIFFPQEWYFAYKYYMLDHKIDFKEFVDEGDVYFVVNKKYRPHVWKLDKYKERCCIQWIKLSDRRPSVYPNQYLVHTESGAKIALYERSNLWSTLPELDDLPEDMISHWADI